MEHSVAGASGWTAAIQAADSAAPAPYIIDIGSNNFSVGSGGSADNPAIGSNANITVIGNGIISLTGTGSLLNIPSGATVTLNGPTLRGNVSNNTVTVSGSFNLQNGVIAGNTNSGPGGGVHIASGGTFTLDSPASMNSVSTNSTGNVQKSGSGGEVSRRKALCVLCGSTP
jgi:hypothetical protein